MLLKKIFMKERYEAAKQEKEISELWQTNKTYSFDKNSSKPIFSVDTPPPTVSGALHIGHVFSYVHADLVSRYMRKNGKEVYYPMGFDDNGLPTEKFVEKQRGIRSKELKRSDFIKICLEECHAVEEKFKSLWMSLGLSIDWNYCYSTISDLSRKVSQRSFLDMYQKGLVYRKEEPSLFCTDFRTTVAQADLETVEKPSTFNTIKFKLEDGSDLLIATTRPELLPACVAIFVHPDDQKNKHLIGQKATVPLFGQQVEIIADQAVQPDKGTGVVMCCTFGDHQDVVWFKNHNLSLIKAIGQDGKMTSAAGILAGLKVHAAREEVLHQLDNAGLLVEKKAIVHTVHIYERSKKEIEYMVSSQWFINLLDFKEDFLKIGATVSWFPPFMQARYNDWVKNLSWDWCISRQRYFGIPFPVWHCQDCFAVLVAEAKDLPIDPQESSYPKGSCDKCGSKNITPDTDVMDTWATSGSTPAINLEMVGLPADKFFPMSMRPQAHDIIRTWAFYTIAKTSHNFGVQPWNDIVISGHVLADQGKISKSLGNSVFSPENLIQTYSADAVRFWSAKGKLGVDTAFSPEQLKNGQRLVTKLWNAIKFCYENSKDYTPEPDTSSPNYSSFDMLSKWVLQEFKKSSKAYHEAFQKYEYSNALEEADSFFWHIFCDNYLEVVKDQIFNPGKYYSGVLEQVASVLYTVGLGLLEMYAPFLPFLTESLYKDFFQSRDNCMSIHTKNYANYEWIIENQQAQDQLEDLIEILAGVRKLKSEHNLSLKVEIAQLHVFSHLPDWNVDAILIQLLLGATKAHKIITSKLHFENSTLELVETNYIVKVNGKGKIRNG